MYWHIDTDFIALTVIAIIYFYDMRLPAVAETRQRDKRFSRCLLASLIVTAVDIAASIIMEVTVPRFIYHLLMTMYFAGLEFIMVEWILYVNTFLFYDDEKNCKKTNLIIVVSYMFYAVFTVLNPWTGAIYSLGPNNEYTRGPFFMVMILLYIFYTITLFALIVVRRKHVPRGTSYIILLLIPSLVALGIYLQLSVPGWLMIIPMHMVGLVAAFFYCQNTRVQQSNVLVKEFSHAALTDPLTGLMNRSGMEAAVQKTLIESSGKTALVLIVDIDDLKTINDTNGHLAGDSAIRSVASCIKGHFRSTDTVVRFGGDEFLAFLVGNLDKQQMNQYLQRLMNKLNAIRLEEYGQVPVHVSIGAVHGIVGKDTFESLCGKADAALYHAKRTGKNQFTLFEDGMETEISSRTTVIDR